MEGIQASTSPATFSSKQTVENGSLQIFVNLWRRMVWKSNLVRREVVRAKPISTQSNWQILVTSQLVECRKAHGEKVMAWVGIIDVRCLMVWWIGKWGSLPGESFEGHSIAKRHACCNKERILVSTGWSKQPRYRTMFVTLAIGIWSSNHISQHAKSLVTIFARPFTTGLFFLEPMYAICEAGEAQEHMWSPLARLQICREHRWRNFEKNGAAQQKTSCSLCWFTRWSLRAVIVNTCFRIKKIQIIDAFNIKITFITSFWSHCTCI